MSEDLPKRNNMQDWRILWWAVLCVVGTSATVLAYMAGWSIRWSDELRALLEGYPLFLDDQAARMHPVGMLAIVIMLTLIFVWAVMGEHPFFKRLALLLSVMLLSVSTTFVTALWGWFVSPVPVLISLIVGGAGALIAPFLLTGRGSHESA